MHEIFISYRRDDSQDAVGRLHDWFDDYFGSQATFRDIDSILGGERFPARLENAIDECRVVLVVIGPRWLSVVGKTGRPRIQEDGDHVCSEIARALERGKPVIPVLVSGAAMVLPELVPDALRELCSLHAQAVDSGRGFRQGLEILVRQVAGITGLGVHDYPTAVRHCRDLELTSTWLGLMSTDPELVAEIGTAKDLIIVMNDGRGFIDSMQETIRSRYEHADKTTRIVTLHPRSSVLGLIIKKNSKARRVQLGEMQRGFESLCTHLPESPKPRLHFRGSHAFFPCSYLLSERVAFVSPYFCEERGSLPVFKFVHTARTPKSLYPHLWRDANAVFEKAIALQVTDYLPSKRTARTEAADD